LLGEVRAHWAPENPARFRPFALALLSVLQRDAAQDDPHISRLDWKLALYVVDRTLGTSTGN
jgi:hypothetical protein